MSHAVRKVLLVDDDKVTNLLHTRLINRTGLVDQVDVAIDGQFALEYLQDIEARQDQQPELILLDINMPRMNGFEFLEAYAELPYVPSAQQIVVILSTSLLKSDHQRAESDPNVFKFANKPLHEDEIIGLVSEIKARGCASH
jgi:CheY-like chemotaxis protein